MLRMSVVKREFHLTLKFHFSAEDRSKTHHGKKFHFVDWKY